MCSPNYFVEMALILPAQLSQLYPGRHAPPPPQSWGPLKPQLVSLLSVSLLLCYTAQLAQAY